MLSYTWNSSRTTEAEAETTRGIRISGFAKKSTLMKMIHKLILAVLLIASVNAKQGDGLDLPSSDPLRIGIKKRGDCSYVFVRLIISNHTYIPLNLYFLISRVKSKSGDTLSVHYVGKLYKNNKEFDSSRKR